VSIPKYGEARKIIERAGLSNADEILAYLGFKVQWKGWDINKANIGLK